MRGKRQKIQYSLALEPVGQGETPVSGHQGTEPFVAKPTTESPAAEQLMEEVCERENLVRAWKRVRRNKGSPGVDGMTIDDAKDYLREHWPGIRSQLLAGTYQPQPVKRVEIPKPDGGFRKLGVPCVVDRLIQQALLQVLQERWDPTFSRHSYGFRPGRSAHQAVAQAQRYIAAGYNVVVDLDLEKFFDRVNHDSLMARVAARVTDKRVLKLIRAFLKSGVMEDGLVSPVDEGTPQGGPLSPLLSNLVLDDLDTELASPGQDPPDTGDQPTAADRRPDAIPHRMARLLRLLPDPTCAHEPGSVDPPKITLVSLAAMAERAQSLQRTAPSWRAKVQCSSRRRFTDGVLAHVRTPGGPTSSAQPLF
jgi:RNA-directed DNA polymerase